MMNKNSIMQQAIASISQLIDSSVAISNIPSFYKKQQFLPGLFLWIKSASWRFLCKSVMGRKVRDAQD